MNLAAIEIQNALFKSIFECYFVSQTQYFCRGSYTHLQKREKKQTTTNKPTNNYNKKSMKSKKSETKTKPIYILQ